MPKNTRTSRRRKLSAIAQRRLPLDAPAHPREEYRLRDLIGRLDRALNTYIGEGDRAVVEEAAAYLNELYLATTEEARPADIREKHPKDKAMGKMKFSHQWKQSRMIAGVCVPISYGLADDYDELLREAVRVALRMNISADDNWDDLYTRIRQLMTAYIASPEGQGEDPSVLMARLAACVADVVPARTAKSIAIGGRITRRTFR